MPTGTTQRGTKQPNPRDFTGKQKAAAEAAHAEELAARSEEISLMTQAQSAARAEEVDYTKGGHSAPGQVQPTPDRPRSPELEESAVEVGPKEVTIYVNSKIEDMVYGRNVEPAVFDDDGVLVQHARDHGLQFFSFDEGTPYRVNIDLARHLDELGYLRH